MLILPLHEHSICFHLFVSSSSVFCSFPSTGLLPPWLNLFVGTLVFVVVVVVAIVNGIFLLVSLSDRSCWCIKTPSMSEYWLCILLCCQIHLISQVVFWWRVWFFVCNPMLSVKNDSFTSSFPIWMAFYSYLIAVARTCSTILVRVVKVDTPWLVPDLKGNALLLPIEFHVFLPHWCFSPSLFPSLSL